MHLLLFGINHERTPVALRERFSFSPAQAEAALPQLRAVDGVQEILLIHTCNRTEVLVHYEGRASDVIDRLNPALAKLCEASPLLPEHLVVRIDSQAVEHVFRLAAGLESMILGEPQILGQLKDAYRLATKAGTSGFLLNKLMHRAFRAGKRVRTETRIGGGAVSISHAAAELALAQLDQLQHPRLLIIGAGEMARIVVETMQRRSACPITLLNRTLENARRLASETQTSFRAWEEFDHVLLDHELILTATAATAPILTTADLEGKGPHVLIDIGVPRNIAPDVAKLPGIRLFTIDDLHATAEAGLDLRREEIPAAEALLDEEVAAFCAWFRSLAVEPAVKQLVDTFEAIRQKELERVRGKFSPEQQAALDELSHRLTRKFLHHPIRRLKNSHSGHVDKSEYWIQMVRELFDLPEGPDA